jgi:hypothetical protein
MKEVAGDVTHSLLHLDSRVWRTLRLLVLRPGELTREFIAGRQPEACSFQRHGMSRLITISNRKNGAGVNQGQLHA